MRYRLFVEVGKSPRAFWTEAAELAAAAWSPDEPDEPEDEPPDALAELLLW